MMTRLLYLLAILLSSAALHAADFLTWDFTNSATSADWQYANRLTATPTAEGLQLDLVAWDSSLEAAELSIDPAECGGLSFEYCAEGFSEPTTGQVYFRTAAAPNFDDDKEIALPPLVCDGDWHTLTVEPAQARGGARHWNEGKRIVGLRFDFADQFPGRILLKTIKALPKPKSRAAAHGLPEFRPVELPSANAKNWNAGQDESDTPLFASPMTAPANGGFDHIGHCYLRREFEVPANVKQALLQTVCDDEIAALYLNGRKIDCDWSRNWKKSDCVELAPDRFTHGKNLLAVDYANTGAIGGLMLDLQLVLEDGSFLLVTMEGARGTTKAPPANWAAPDARLSWPLAETRPGAPNPPWRETPTYRSIRPNQKKLSIELLGQDGSAVELLLRGEPALEDTERFAAKLLSGQKQDVLVKNFTGTLAEFGASRQEDGSYRLRLDDRGYLRCGAPVDALWQFGMPAREGTGDLQIPFHLGERPMPGEKAVLKLAQTPNGPVPMLNGKPFYFNALTVEFYQVPSGMEGHASPFNVIVTRAGGLDGDWWTGPDQYDFTVLDRQLNFALANYPDAMLGFYVWCEPGLWYSRLYPERMSIDENGNTYGYYVSAIGFSNPEWRKEAQAALEKLVRHCEKYFGPRMVLYGLQGGATCEWQGWTAHHELFSDYSDAEAKEFAKFAEAHGKTVAEVPAPRERTAKAGKGPFRNPVSAWKSILYDEFYNFAMARTVAEFAAAVKRACSRDKLVGAYFGYHQEFAELDYCVNSGGHNDLRQLLDSPDMDFFLSPNSYGLRALGTPNGEMKPVAAIRAAGKLAMVEDDTRTHLTPPVGPDQTLNLQDTIAVFQRNLGQYLANGMPINQLPLNGGNELDHPAIRKLFGRALQAGQFRYEHPVTARAEIAAVIDEDSLKYFAATYQKPTTPETCRYAYNSEGQFVDNVRYVLPVSGEMLYYQRYPLAQCGAPVDWILLDDVPRMASRYKLVILLGAYADTPELRKAVAALKAAGTRTMVVYGAGFIDTEREEFSDTPMDELLDLNIRMVKPGSIAVKFPDGRTAGADYTVEPRFAVDDPQATALAAYASNHKLVAAAEKGNMLFYGGALLDADFVRETARQSGAHIYCESTDNLAAGNGIVSIHCNQPGVKTIRFPEATDVVDLFGGEVLGRNVTEVSFPMKGFETRVLITGDADEMLSAFTAVP